MFKYAVGKILQLKIMMENRYNEIRIFKKANLSLVNMISILTFTNPFYKITLFPLINLVN